MTTPPVPSPARLSALGSAAPPSLRSALSAAARHEPTPGELARLALSLSPLLNAPPLPRAGSPAPSGSANPSPAERPAGLRWSGAGWRMGRGAVLLAGTAALLLGLPRIWSAAHPTPVATPEEPTMSPPAPQPVLQKMDTTLPPEAPAPLPQSSPTPREPRGKSRSVAPPAGAPLSAETAASPVIARQESEVTLLERARRLLQTSPRQSLELVREHERRFASGVLVQEREIVAIDALERLGRTDEARAREERFRARYPSSVHGQRIEVPSGQP